MLLIFLGIVLLAVVVSTLYLQPRRVFTALGSFAWTGLGPGALFYSSTDKRRIALTIDDAPAASTTPEILAVLAHYNVVATFFCMSDEVERNSDLVREMVAAGHQLGSHMTENRPSIELTYGDFKARFDQAKRILEDYSQARITWFRPGWARFTPAMRAYAEKAGCRIVLGDVFPYDPTIRNSSFAAKMILQGVRPGSIIILHDGAGPGSLTPETLRRVIPILKVRGYKFVTLDKLFANA